MEVTANKSPSQTSSMGSMNMNMSMSSISWNTHCVVFLFEQFHAKNSYQFAFGCFVVFVVAVFSQLMMVNSIKKSILGHSERKKQKSQEITPIVVDSERVCHDAQISSNSNFKPGNTQNKSSSFQILLTKLKMVLYYSIYGLISLLLMLLAMTMNGYVILSVAVGTGIGKTISMSINEADSIKRNSKRQQNQSIDIC